MTYGCRPARLSSLGARPRVVVRRQLLIVAEGYGPTLIRRACTHNLSGAAQGTARRGDPRAAARHCDS